MGDQQEVLQHRPGGISLSARDHGEKLRDQPYCTMRGDREYRGKRGVDLLLVTLSAPLWVPLLLGIAAVVRIGLGRPVLFRQKRVGLAEREFTLVKFRTMLPADEADQDEDLRLTRLGRVLRSTSLDELPELINVLRGEMSLVGPRPLLPQYVSRYSSRHRRRHAVRPGLTGLAQVQGRNAVSWEERLDMDVAYVETNSFLLDMRLLGRTVAAVLRRRGVNAPEGPIMPEFTGYDSQP